MFSAGRNVRPGWGSIRAGDRAHVGGGGAQVSVGSDACRAAVGTSLIESSSALMFSAPRAPHSKEHRD